MGPALSVKAPGKILWIGGFSVLEQPNISYVSTVNAYVTATISRSKENVVLLEAPQLSSEGPFRGVLERGTGRIDIPIPDALKLFKTAAEVASRYVVARGKELSGFHITTINDAPLLYSLSSGSVKKSGLGSSAAVTVATIGALLVAFGVDPEEHEALHKLAQTAHSIATEKVGSGFDIAAATFGSIIYSRYSPEIMDALPKQFTNEQLLEHVKKPWDYEIKKMDLLKPFKLLFANFGEAMITTQAIGSVSDYKMRDKSGYYQLINGIDEANVEAIDALKRVFQGDRAALEQFKVAFEIGRLFTKKLGVESGVGIEPDDCTALIEESQAKGAFVAKLPGAGGKDAIAALCLTNDDKNALESFWTSRPELHLLDIQISGRGYVVNGTQRSFLRRPKAAL